MSSIELPHGCVLLNNCHYNLRTRVLTPLSSRTEVNKPEQRANGEVRSQIPLLGVVFQNAQLKMI